MEQNGKETLMLLNFNKIIILILLSYKIINKKLIT